MKKIDELKYNLLQQRGRQDELNLRTDKQLSNEYAEVRAYLANHVIPSLTAPDVVEDSDIAALLVHAASALPDDASDAVTRSLILALRALEARGVDIDAMAADHHVAGLRD